jgi:hypothetical protein
MGHTRMKIRNLFMSEIGAIVYDYLEARDRPIPFKLDKAIKGMPTANRIEGHLIGHAYGKYQRRIYKHELLRLLAKGDEDDISGAEKTSEYSAVVDVGAALAKQFGIAMHTTKDHYAGDILTAHTPLKWEE